LARITPIPGGRYIEASLHDVQSGRQLREHGVTVPANFADVEPRMNELLGSLLSYSSALPGDGTLLGTTRLAAWRALQRGQEALGAWDLAEARAAFSEALAEDSSYAAAAYWLAQVEHWIGDSPRSARRGLASRAVALSDDLPESERRQARALAHLASGSYVRACEEYDRLISTDSVNIVAWLGRAVCHVQDNAVLPDSTSRTGWRFRSSRRAAMQS